MSPAVHQTLATAGIAYCLGGSGFPLICWFCVLSPGRRRLGGDGAALAGTFGCWLVLAAVVEPTARGAVGCELALVWADPGLG